MKKLNKRGFVLLETVIVSVFIISIFTFIYVSVVPLLGRYEALSNDYDIDVAYKLYHIRDAIYKDSNFSNIVKNDYKRIENTEFNDDNYYNSLTSSLFGETNYQIIYVRKLNRRVDMATNNLSVSGGFKEYIEKIAKTKTGGNLQNFIFLENDGKYAYLGLAVNLNDMTNYEDPVIIDEGGHFDPSNPNPPLLMDGMIPICYKDGAWYKADATNNSLNYAWYNYQNFQWANVALVKESKREYYETADYKDEIIINDSDIIAFYVWIPRYEYVIQGTYGLGGTSAASPGEISVNFIGTDAVKSRSETIDGKKYTWRTASAFTFGEDELTGFWFAKFEVSNSELSGYTYNGISVPYVLPTKTSWTGLKIAEFYQKITTYMNGTNGNKIYGFESENYISDAHMMKNDEWGAVAYLSQSKYGKYGNTNFSGAKKEVYINNRQSSGSDISIITGSSAGKNASEAGETFVTKTCSSQPTAGAGCYQYFVEVYGTGASTTGTIYGIYDMSGGKAEFVMGALGMSSAKCGSKIYAGVYKGHPYEAKGFSGFKGAYTLTTGVCTDDDSSLINFPTDGKYYNIYGSALNGCLDSFGTFTGPCYSHAMKETETWYMDVAEKINKEYPWYIRGGTIAASSGIFALANFNVYEDEKPYTSSTSRPVIAVYEK